VRARGVSFVPAAANAHDIDVLHRTMTSSLVAGARPALLFAAAVALAGAFVALLIPNPSPASPEVAAPVEVGTSDIANAEVVVLAEGGAW
jgi:hypothetical protein